MLIKINAENTLSGNPQRGWVLVDKSGAFVKFYDEGYDDGGQEKRDLVWEGEKETMSFNVTVKEYKRIRGLVA